MHVRNNYVKGGFWLELEEPAPLVCRIFAPFFVTSCHEGVATKRRKMKQ